MKSLRPLPPRLFLRFFRWFCHPKLRDGIEGDLMEVYHERVNDLGKRRGDVKFIADVLLLFRPGIIRPAKPRGHSIYYDMYKNYFKVAFRILLSNKSFSFINISGLAVGMAACVMIMLYVVDEMSFDKHHPGGDRIFRIASVVKEETWVAAAAPTAEGLQKDFPEVEESTRLLRFPGAEQMLIRDEQSEKQFFENNAYYVDSTFFRIFSYELKFGDITTALNGPNSIVISEQVATKFFGQDDPTGQVLKIGLSFGDFNYTVQGVLRDTKKKSHIPANLLLSMNNGDVGAWAKSQTNWASNNIFHTYVKLREGSDPKAFESKLPDFLERRGGKDFKASGYTRKLFIQPLEDIYLHSDYGYEVAPNGSIRYLHIFTSIAVFLLLIACINFMNLSTSRSEKRAREVGLRKVVGAARGSLVGQFLSESLLMSTLALIFAFAMILVLLPFFNQLTNKNLSLAQLPYLYSWLAGLSMITGLFAGIYPAFYLSSFKPITVLKGKLRNSISASAIRKGLVVFQFTISIVLILGATVISQQMNYMKNQSLGFNKNQKLILPIQTNEALANNHVLQNELKNNSRIISVSGAGAYPGVESITSMLFYGEGKAMQDNVEIQTIYTEPDYLQTLGIELLHGRKFSTEIKNDEGVMIVNESAVKRLGYTPENAVGRKMFFEFQNKTQSMEIAGVVKDYHFQSLHQAIKPLAMSVTPFFTGPNRYIILDVKSSAYSELIATIQNTWTKINPNSPFSYSFLDQDFQRNYIKEERTSQLVGYFTIVAVVIACMGLFGLATFTAEQRIKEIGVRKVLGASISQVVALLSRDFLKLVILAIVVSSPIAYYAMNTWLEGFAYHVDMEWWVFVLAGLAAVLIALFTVSYQAIKAAIANPVQSLRSNE